MSRGIQSHEFVFSRPGTQTEMGDMMLAHEDIAAELDDLEASLGIGDSTSRSAGHWQPTTAKASAQPLRASLPAPSGASRAWTASMEALSRELAACDPPHAAASPRAASPRLASHPLPDSRDSNSSISLLDHVIHPVSHARSQIASHALPVSRETLSSAGTFEFDRDSAPMQTLVGHAVHDAHSWSPASPARSHAASEAGACSEASSTELAAGSLPAAGSGTGGTGVAGTMRHSGGRSNSPMRTLSRLSSSSGVGRSGSAQQLAPLGSTPSTPTAARGGAGSSSIVAGMHAMQEPPPASGTTMGTLRALRDELKRAQTASTTAGSADSAATAATVAGATSATSAATAATVAVATSATSAATATATVTPTSGATRSAPIPHAGHSRTAIPEAVMAVDAAGVPSALEASQDGSTVEETMEQLAAAAARLLNHQLPAARPAEVPAIPQPQHSPNAQPQPHSRVTSPATQSHTPGRGVPPLSLPAPVAVVSGAGVVVSGVGPELVSSPYEASEASETSSDLSSPPESPHRWLLRSVDADFRSAVVGSARPEATQQQLPASPPVQQLPVTVQQSPTTQGPRARSLSQQLREEEHGASSVHTPASAGTPDTSTAGAWQAVAASARTDPAVVRAVTGNGPAAAHSHATHHAAAHAHATHHAAAHGIFSDLAVAAPGRTGRQEVQGSYREASGSHEEGAAPKGPVLYCAHDSLVPDGRADMGGRGGVDGGPGGWESPATRSPGKGAGRSAGRAADDYHADQDHAVRMQALLGVSGAPLSPEEVACAAMYYRDQAARRKLEERHAAFREVLEESALLDCSFSPSVSPGSKRIVRSGSPAPYLPNSYMDPAADKAHERLYKHAQVKARRLQERVLQEELQSRAAREFRSRSPGHQAKARYHSPSPHSTTKPLPLPTGLEHCTFRPALNTSTNQHTLVATLRQHPGSPGHASSAATASAAAHGKAAVTAGGDRVRGGGDRARGGGDEQRDGRRVRRLTEDLRAFDRDDAFECALTARMPGSRQLPHRRVASAAPTPAGTLRPSLSAVSSRPASAQPGSRSGLQTPTKSSAVPSTTAGAGGAVPPGARTPQRKVPAWGSSLQPWDRAALGQAAWEGGRRTTGDSSRSGGGAPPATSPSPHPASDPHFMDFPPPDVVSFNWDEFMERQYQHLLAQQRRVATAHQAERNLTRQHRCLSPGSQRILVNKYQEGVAYVPPQYRPLATGPPTSSSHSRRSSGPIGSRSPASASVRDSSNSQWGSDVQPPLDEECTFQPRISPRAAALPAPTVDMLTDGGRRARERWLAEQLRQQAERDSAVRQAAFVARPSPQGQPKGRLSLLQPGQYLEAMAAKKRHQELRAYEELRRREHEEMAACTFHPQTTPLPAYIMRQHIMPGSGYKGSPSTHSQRSGSPGRISGSSNVQAAGRAGGPGGSTAASWQGSQQAVHAGVAHARAGSPGARSGGHVAGGVMRPAGPGSSGRGGSPGRAAPSKQPPAPTAHADHPISRRGSMGRPGAAHTAADRRSGSPGASSDGGHSQQHMAFWGHAGVGMPVAQHATHGRQGVGQQNWTTAVAVSGQAELPVQPTPPTQSPWPVQATVPTQAIIPLQLDDSLEDLWLGEQIKSAEAALGGGDAQHFQQVQRDLGAGSTATQQTQHSQQDLGAGSMATQQTMSVGVSGGTHQFLASFPLAEGSSVDEAGGLSGQGSGAVLPEAQDKVASRHASAGQLSVGSRPGVGSTGVKPAASPLADLAQYKQHLTQLRAALRQPAL